MVGFCGYGVMRLCGYEVIRFWGYEVVFAFRLLRGRPVCLPLRKRKTQKPYDL